MTTSTMSNTAGNSERKGFKQARLKHMYQDNRKDCLPEEEQRTKRVGHHLNKADKEESKTNNLHRKPLADGDPSRVLLKSDLAATTNHTVSGTIRNQAVPKPKVATALSGEVWKLLI
ncbi:hypothetical protein BTVI_143107 [Pitangus sulphuratus]|nr:hypothetical protein BTVI_143107 [Pitangus sulphuratus]